MARPHANDHHQVRIRLGLTVLELLVVMTIIGIVVALLLPAIIRVRESARLTCCSNHMRQLGIAVHDHHNTHRELPPSWQVVDGDQHFAYGWATKLLGGIEQEGLRQSLPLHQRPNLTGSVARQLSLPLMLCPSDIVEPSFVLMQDIDDDDDDDTGISIVSPRPLMVLPTANYLGVYGTVEADDFDEYTGPLAITYGDGSLINDRRIQFADLQRGLSNTVLIGERKMSAVPSTWIGVDLRGEDAGCRLAGSAITHPIVTSVMNANSAADTWAEPTFYGRMVVWPSPVNSLISICIGNPPSVIRSDKV